VPADSILSNSPIFEIEVELASIIRGVVMDVVLSVTSALEYGADLIVTACPALEYDVNLHLSSFLMEVL